MVIASKSKKQITNINGYYIRCAEALQTEGLDLINLLNNDDEKTFDNVLHSFTSIAAIQVRHTIYDGYMNREKISSFICGFIDCSNFQVALTDMLTSMGITPDGIVGHSVGELGCAYADGTFTAQQTVLAAFWRGRSILESKLPPGAMAAVGQYRLYINRRDLNGKKTNGFCRSKDCPGKKPEPAVHQTSTPLAITARMESQSLVLSTQSTNS